MNRQDKIDKLFEDIPPYDDKHWRYVWKRVLNWRSWLIGVFWTKHFFAVYLGPITWIRILKNRPKAGE